MAHLSSHLQLQHSNGDLRLCIKLSISHKAQLGEDLLIPSRMRLVSYLVLRIQQIPRASIQSQEASTDMLSIPKPNPLSRGMRVFLSLNQCRTMALPTMALLIRDLLTCHSIHIQLPNNNLVEAWVTTWLDRVLTTHSHLIMHHLIWHLAQ